jgi:hypothetical protein
VQATESFVGPYALQDFNLFYLTRLGYRPSKIAFLAWNAWHDVMKGAWPANVPASARPRLFARRDPPLAGAVPAALLRQPVQAVGIAQWTQDLVRRFAVAARRLACAFGRQPRCLAGRTEGVRPDPVGGERCRPSGLSQLVFSACGIRVRQADGFPGRQEARDDRSRLNSYNTRIGPGGTPMPLKMKKTVQQMVDEAVGEIETGAGRPDAIKLVGQPGVPPSSTSADPRASCGADWQHSRARSTSPRGMLEMWIDPESPLRQGLLSKSGDKFIFCPAPAPGGSALQPPRRRRNDGHSPVAHLRVALSAWNKAGGPLVMSSRKK